MSTLRSNKEKSDAREGSPLTQWNRRADCKAQTKIPVSWGWTLPSVSSSPTPSIYCYLSSSTLSPWIMDPWWWSQFLLAGKLTKSAHFLLSSDLFSWHTHPPVPWKKSRIPGRYPELAQNSSCFLFQLPLQHSSQQCLMGFPKLTQRVVWTALCHSSPLPQIPLEELWKKILIDTETWRHSWWKPKHFKDVNSFLNFTGLIPSLTNT